MAVQKLHARPCRIVDPDTIVWLDYFSLAAVPLAIVRPVLSPIWLLPLLTWGAPGTGLGIGDPLQILRVLGVFAIVLGVAARAEHDLRRGAPTASARATPAHPVDRSVSALASD